MRSLRILFAAVAIMGCADSDPSPGEPVDESWSLITSGTSADLAGIWGTGKNDVWAVGDNGTVIHYDGSSWSKVESNTTVALEDVWGFGPADVWAVGGVWDDQLGTGSIFHFDGDRWSEALSDAPQPLVAVWGASPDNVYALGGADEAVYLTHFDGSSWAPMAAPPNGPDMETTLGGTDIWGFGSDDLFVSSLNSVVHFSGESWTYLQSMLGPSHPAYAVWGPTSERVYVAHDFGLIDSWNGGAWSEEIAIREAEGESRTYFNGIWGFGEDAVFAVGGYWGRTDTTPHHGFADGATAYRFDGTRWTEQKIRSLCTRLNAVWGASAEEVWAVGAEGVVLRYRP